MLQSMYKSGVVALTCAFVLMVTSLVFSIFVGLGWQEKLSSLNTKLADLLNTDQGAFISIVCVLVLAYIFLDFGLNQMLSSTMLDVFKLLIFLYFEFSKLIFLTIFLFLVATIIVFNLNSNKDFTSSIFFEITILTFILSIVSYWLLETLLNFSFKNKKFHKLAKESKSRLFKEYEIGGLSNTLVILITVLLFADTLGNNAYEILMKNVLINPNDSNVDTPSLDDFINSRIFLLIIPSLAIYLLSVRLGFSNGFKKITNPS